LPDGKRPTLLLRKTIIYMIFLGVVIVAGFAAAILSFAVGANDVANALGTSVGSKSLSIKWGIAIGALFEFLGCLSMGGNVSTTLSKDLVKVDLYANGDARSYMTGMLAAIIGYPFSATAHLFLSAADSCLLKAPLSGFFLPAPSACPFPPRKPS
jgi:phosphate/sulfate permease